MVWLRFLLIVGISAALGAAAAIESDISTWDSPQVVDLEVSDRTIDENVLIDTRVVNGAMASPGQFPWHVLLYARRRDNSWVFCAASLLSRNTVITEGSCLNGAVEVRTFIGSPVFGRGTTVQGHRFILHPRFRPNTEFSLGIVQLISHVILSQNIRPIPLVPQAYEAFAFENFLLPFAGFGSNVPTQPHSHLIWNVFRALPLDVCTRNFPSSARNMFICVQSTNTAGSHPGFGDQGGGLIWRHNNRDHIVGIFTRVVNPGNLSIGPYGFINLGPHQRWISNLVALA